MSRLTSAWRNRLRRAHVDRELDEELRATLDVLVDEKTRTGMSPDEARHAARVELGSLESVKTQVRDARAGAALDRVVRDLAYSARALVKKPGAALAIVATFALGSAAIITTFALVNAILLQPLPYAEPHRLVAVKHAAPGLGLPETGMSAGTYFHYRRHAGSLESLALYSETAINLSTPDSGTERVELTFAGPEFFDVLGIEPVLGRLFTHEDARPGFMDMTWPVPVLLSHELWTRRYGSDPGIVGGTITLNDRARHVVGVLPRGFGFPRPETQIWMLWVPSEATATVASSFEYQAIGRLRRDVDHAAAEADLTRTLPALEGAYRDATPERLVEVRLRPIVVPLSEYVTGHVASLLWLFFGGMAVLLLVACANVSTLSVLRADQRHREVAVRTALGATRAAILRLFVCEAALLAAAGAAVGVLLARFALGAVVAFAPVRLPRLHEVDIDAWVAVFACALAVAGALLFGGMAYLRHAMQTSPAAGLRSSSGVTLRRRRVRIAHALVAAQVALALPLLVGSALTAQSVWRLMRVDPGFNPGGVLTVEIGLPGSLAARHQQIYGTLLGEVRALAGVRSAAAASSLPLDGTPEAFPFAVGDPARPSEAPVAMKFVMPGYFETMQMPVLEGTVAGLDARVGTGHPVVVSATFARRYFPGVSAVGRQIRRLESNGEPVSMFDSQTRTFRAAPAWTIVGVVADVREESLRTRPAEMVYVPVVSPPVEPSRVPTSMAVVIRSNLPAGALATAVRHTIRAVEPALSVARVRTMDEIVMRSVARERALAVLFAGASVVSLFLGAIGVYGVAAQAVRRRRQEIGIRVSLGARPSQLVRSVMRETAVSVALGAAAGLVLALAATRTVRAFLFEVSAIDPGSISAVTALLVVVALAASFVPARRAARLDPAAVLRAD